MSTDETASRPGGSAKARVRGGLGQARMTGMLLAPSPRDETPLHALARRRRRRSMALLALALTVAFPCVAHHSYAAFDANRRVVLEGTVRSFHWANPHVTIELAV